MLCVMCVGWGVVSGWVWLMWMGDVWGVVDVGVWMGVVDVDGCGERRCVGCGVYGCVWIYSACD